MIALSCGVKISLVGSLVEPQSTRVTDGQMDGRTDRITAPNSSRGKNRRLRCAHAAGNKMF